MSYSLSNFSFFGLMTGRYVAHDQVIDASTCWNSRIEQECLIGTAIMASIAVTEGARACS